MFKVVGVLCLFVLLLESCVSKKEMEALQSKYDSAQEEIAVFDKFKADKEAEFLEKMQKKDSEIEAWKDSSDKEKRMQEFYRNNILALEQTNRTLEDNYLKVLKSTSGRNKVLFEQLAEKQEDLELRLAEILLKEDKISHLEGTLLAREARVKELENIVGKLDSAAKAIKEKILKSLYGFDNSQISAEVKEGKVYISLSNEILFESGSAKVNSKGKEAVKLLAGILAQDTSVAVNIEGHTDSDKGVDNWDLSTKRSLAIVATLLNTKERINPSRITASGRGEFDPVAANTTAEGKAKNRRIEIILTPDLKAIYDFLGKL